MDGIYQPVRHQSKAYTGTAGVIDNAIGSGIRVIRVVVTSAGYIVISTAGTAATTAGIYMPANIPEYFIVPAGAKVSAIQASAGGDVHVTEMG